MPIQVHPSKTVVVDRAQGWIGIFLRVPLSPCNRILYEHGPSQSNWLAPKNISTNIRLCVDVIKQKPTLATETAPDVSRKLLFCCERIFNIIIIIIILT